ncbi:Tex family protein [Paludibaculum fermentans]|uniref:RNA-binding transcriptional accessory protein n=1 Tax=Paludibaculum fermentans TaxID=1473598 RepID=A0A7S7SK01_PALFE|nr:Tex family protein [Paludibaculum fermentans]QOY88627.1 RNA-binding transcriptional accessory protein [Paludibaculum fermentans]
MPELKSLSPEILIHVAQVINVPLKGLTATIELLDEGGTVPFIARYRKEATGNLDEVQIRSIEEKLAYFRELEDRRATILASIEEQGKLTPELKARIEKTLEKSELEDLYLPYKPKRRTKATIAREKGLEPLALYLWTQEPAELPLEAFAATFVNAEKGVNTTAEALEGARHIIAEMISENADLRKALRQMMFDEGVVVSRKVMDAVDEQEKFKMYYEYREPVSKIPSHRMLAIRRGESENVLYFTIELEPVRALDLVRRFILKTPGDWTPQLELASDDSYNRLLNSSIQTEIRLELKKRADSEAIQVFRENLQNLLLAPPAGQLGVMGIDPGIRTGCKIAIVDETGKYLENTVIYPQRGDTAGAMKTLKSLITKFNVKAIAIGNGTASRETDAFVREFLQQEKLDTVFSVTVNESGASIYSASDIARQEFPDLDLTVRGAISIARRLQDPLAELVKIDPKSIGVGQYQHDVDQRQLQQSLETVIESCVNRVGVELNTASWALLRYVAGISERTALKIVEYRNENGKFTSRVQLTAVPGIGPKTFEQAAGFLRIRGASNPLDMTAVHPESYPVVAQIAERLGVKLEEIIQQPQLLEKFKKDDIAVGVYTLNDILEELRKPGRDPRDKFVAPSFKEGVKEIADVQPGMVLEGVVTNVTKFGAFVDVGVHQDGLVHISELSNRYIQDASEVVKAGQIVKVKVLSADAKTKRIALSIKALQGPPPQKPQRPQQAKPSMDDKLAALSSKWKVR